MYQIFFKTDMPIMVEIISPVTGRPSTEMVDLTGAADCEVVDAEKLKGRFGLDPDQFFSDDEMKSILASNIQMELMTAFMAAGPFSAGKDELKDKLGGVCSEIIGKCNGSWPGEYGVGLKAVNITEVS